MIKTLTWTVRTALCSVIISCDSDVLCSGYYLQPLFFPGEPSADFKASMCLFFGCASRGHEALGRALLDGDLDEVPKEIA